MAQNDKVITQRNLTSRSMLVMFIGVGVLLLVASLLLPAYASTEKQPKFVRIPTQFIAALGDPTANSGTGAQTWGIWHLDPGPRGVRLGNYEELKAAGGVAPAKWEFDSKEWWVEENGLLMEKPSFPISAGKYVVTGDREMTSILTIHPKDENGEQKWDLSHDAALYDVTHLPCRSARYTPIDPETSCTPGRALDTVFPITPGRSMPSFEGCKKLDYSVLFIVAVELKD